MLSAMSRSESSNKVSRAPRPAIRTRGQHTQKNSVQRKTAKLSLTLVELSRTASFRHCANNQMQFDPLDSHHHTYLMSLFLSLFLHVLSVFLMFPLSFYIFANSHKPSARTQRHRHRPLHRHHRRAAQSPFNGNFDHSFGTPFDATISLVRFSM